MNKKALSERDICTKYITPALKQAGWDEFSQIREEVYYPPRRAALQPPTPDPKAEGLIFQTGRSNGQGGRRHGLHRIAQRACGPRPSSGITICDPSAWRLEVPNWHFKLGWQPDPPAAFREDFIIHLSSLIIP